MGGPLETCPFLQQPLPAQGAGGEGRPEAAAPAQLRSSRQAPAPCPARPLPSSSGKGLASTPLQEVILFLSGTGHVILFGPFYQMGPTLYFVACFLFIHSFIQRLHGAFMSGATQGAKGKMMAKQVIFALLRFNL